MSKDLIKCFIIALIIRLLLAPFFYHPDIKSQNYHYQFFGQGKLNIYKYISENKNNLPYRDTFNYLPATYFTFGILQSFEKLIMPSDFTNWLNDWGGTQYDYSNNIYIILILKLPYIILDLSIGYLLYKISRSKKILYFWLFNPFSFYLIYIVENFDILPSFLTLYSYYLLNKKTSLAFIVFGIAISLKLYPLLLLPFFILSQSKNIFKIIKYSILALIPTILSILPFISDQYFWQSFFGSGLTQKIIELKFYDLPVFPIVYLIILFITFISKKIELPFQIFLIFLLFISVVNFHLQWILWFLPFIFLLKKFLNPQFFLQLIILSIFILLYIFLTNDNYLTWGHLILIDKEFLLISSPYQIIKNRFFIDPSIIQTWIKILISIISLFSIFLYEKNNTHN